MNDSNDNVARIATGTTGSTTPSGAHDVHVSDTIETVTVKQKGYFTILLEKLRNNPITTATTLSVGGAAAVVGANNYVRHGSVLPYRGYNPNNTDIQDVAAAAVSVMGMLRR